MEKIIVKIDPKANKTKLLGVIKMLNGVISAAVTKESLSEDEFMIKKIDQGRKSGEGSMDKVMAYLRK